MTREELSNWHLPRFKALIDSQPDLLAIETIPLVKEAEAILDNLQKFPGVKAWITFL
uniref:Hcy-binding domain-containing protein n=1 Tax=Arion vulgaris TaxID=1028688 RepID=A0A0B7A6Q3_9EUPU